MNKLLKLRLRATRYTLSRLLLLVLLLGVLNGTIPAYAAPLAQGGVQRITFAPGATSATVTGGVAVGQVMRYVLTALAGQTMTVQAYSSGLPVYVTIYDTSRVMMGSVASGQAWTSQLPATGDYSLAVYPSSNAGYTSFHLTVTIVSNSPPTPSAPERIYFAPGTVSATVTGYLPSNSSKQYVLGASAGQVMTINSWTSGGPFRYTLTAPNGAWLGSGDQGQPWSGTLPASGDYLLTLQTPTDAPPANYGLTITIVSAAPPTPTPIPTQPPTPVPPSAQRITFPSGATSVTVSGYVDYASPVRYVLRALRGQTMTLFLSTSHGSPQTVTIRDANGNFLGTAYSGQQWSRYLAATGDYYLDVQAAAGNPGDSYSLYIQIL